MFYLLTGRHNAVLFTLTLVLATASCKARRQMRENSQAQALVANEGSKTNIALIIGGLSRDDVEYADRKFSLTTMEESLKNPLLGFTVNRINDPKGQTSMNASKSEILEATKEAAKSVGEDGTLLWYINSHGSPDGFMSTKETAANNMWTEGRLSMQEVLAAIWTARTEGNCTPESQDTDADCYLNPIRRLIVVVETCYSGLQTSVFPVEKKAEAELLSFAPTTESSEGAGELSLKRGRRIFRREPQRASTPVSVGTTAPSEYKYGKGVYEEGLLITSAGLETSFRTYFAKGFAASLNHIDANAERETLTIRKWLENLNNEVKVQQTVHFKAFPTESLLEEPFIPAGLPK